MLNMADERKADSLPPLIGRRGRRHSVILAPHGKKLLSPFKRNWAATRGLWKFIKCVNKIKRFSWPGGVRGPANQLICITVSFSHQKFGRSRHRVAWPKWVASWWRRLWQVVMPRSGSAQKQPFFFLFFSSFFNSTNCKWLLFHLDFIRKHIKPIKIRVRLFMKGSEGLHKTLDTQYVVANNSLKRFLFFEWNTFILFSLKFPKIIWTGWMCASPVVLHNLYRGRIPSINSGDLSKNVHGWFGQMKYPSKLHKIAACCDWRETWMILLKQVFFS